MKKIFQFYLGLILILRIFTHQQHVSWGKEITQVQRVKNIIQKSNYVKWDGGERRTEEKIWLVWIGQ